MEQKEQEEYLKHLNERSPEGHEAIKLIFENGFRMMEVACLCGCRHPTGRLDQEFVLWDSSTLPLNNSSFTGENLVSHGWKHLQGRDRISLKAPQ